MCTITTDTTRGAAITNIATIENSVIIVAGTDTMGIAGMAIVGMATEDMAAADTAATTSRVSVSISAIRTGAIAITPADTIGATSQCVSASSRRNVRRDDAVV